MSRGYIWGWLRLRIGRESLTDRARGACRPSAARQAFGGAYMLVILIEPVADLAVLAAAKGLRRWKDSDLFSHRLFNAA